MIAMTATHRPQPIIPTDSYSDTIRRALAGRPTAPLDPEPPRRSRIWLETLHRLRRYIRDNARLVIFAGTLGFVAWAILAVIIMTRDAPQQPTYRQGGGAVMVLHAAPIVTVTAMPTVTPTATPQAVASVPSTPIAATVKPPKWLTLACIHNIEVIGAGEFSGITDTLTLEVGMTQIVNTAIQSQCGDASVKGSLFNVWNGWKKFTNSGTAPVIDMYIMHATDVALQNWQLPQHPIYSLFGSEPDLHTWFHGDWYTACKVAQGYPLIKPRVFGLMCVEGK